MVVIYLLIFKNNQKMLYKMNNRNNLLINNKLTTININKIMIKKHKKEILKWIILEILDFLCSRQMMNQTVKTKCK